MIEPMHVHERTRVMQSSYREEFFTPSGVVRFPLSEIRPVPPIFRTPMARMTHLATDTRSPTHAIIASHPHVGITFERRGPRPHHHTIIAHTARNIRAYALK